ncbi:chromate transporter [Clostridium botulinum]|uniref:chromate transporter n=1 Tax=Clostridium botulinum TaxID=1491 RepID=UPI0007743CF4|nr:chromate transporter [Clostridium botulinum]NFE84301.1 chromate transporter [Clostridium botulinum]NFE94993.1 chromate transporter [Clostridium botulinum]NFG38686.1 chromate transporter [Clostridium botulinum]NFL38022.1 chromate transporter [Clostridium botulinum]NFL64312.1 chromate transporter [Clostridium botulinum]
MILLKLFIAFLKIGAFSFGGGYAMITFIQKEIITNNSWLTVSEFMDIIGISQMTPGPVSINSATFVGFKVSGILGSLAATIGIITTSFILVTICSKTLEKFKDSNLVKSALLGMRPVLIALILQAFFDLAKESYIDIKSIIVTLIIGGLLLSHKVHPIICVLISAVLGIVFWSF